jgi:hypothetical protein
MTQEFKVRTATPDDVHQLMEMGIAANDEIGIARANPEKLLMDIWPALHLHGGIIGVIGAPGKTIEGGIVLKITNLWYSDEDFLEERIVYIRPEFRKGGRTLGPTGGVKSRFGKLIEFAKNTSDRLEIPLAVGISTSVGFKGKARMYEHYFGEQAGAFYLYGRKHHKQGFAPEMQAAE